MSENNRSTNVQQVREIPTVESVMTWLLIIALAMAVCVNAAHGSPVTTTRPTTNKKVIRLPELVPQKPIENMGQSTAIIPAEGGPSLVLGLKSYNDSLRLGEVNSSTARQLKSKNEYYMGVKNDQGWGVYGMGVQTGKFYADGLKNDFSAADPSFNIMHPVFDDGHLKITGQFREYFPVTTYELARGQYQQAYYSFLTYKMKNKWDLFNVIIPRYFSQAWYASSDTTFYTEDITTLTRKMFSWLRLGFGEHSQIEFHPGTPTGTTLELFPMADFIVAPGVFLGPRIFFPVAAQNSVYDAPTGVNMDNVQAELYFQATL